MPTDIHQNRKMYERNGTETVVDNDGVLCINEKHMQEGLDHKSLQEITAKYNSNHRKDRYELAEEPKNLIKFL